MASKKMNLMHWYKDLAIQYEMFNFVTNRELMLKSILNFTTRVIKITNVQSFQIWFQNMHFDKKRYNLYYSLGTYFKIPNLSLNLTNRIEDPAYLDFKSNYHKYMIGYDFFLDIDAPEHKDIRFAHYSAKSILEYFDKLFIPYEIRFSGCGFHFIIPYTYFSTYNLSFDPKDDNSIYQLYDQIVNKLASNFSEMIDLGLHDGRRVVKLPYSLAVYDQEVYVCYPFIDKTKFYSFNLDDALPLSFSNEIDFKKNKQQRKTKIFNSRGAINNLLDDLNIKWSKELPLKKILKE